MTQPAIRLATILERLASRNPGRTEADIQADVRTVLMYGGFDLADEQVRLESPAADRRRIDIEVGRLNVECKRDLSRLGALSEAEEQLEGYLRGREQGRPGTYIGMLTDGVTWRHYQTDKAGLRHVSDYTLQPGRIDESKFRTWLGSLLATEHDVPATGPAIGERLGSDSPGHQAAIQLLQIYWSDAKDVSEVRLKRALWGKLLRTAFGTQFQDDEDLFLEHTYLVLIATLVAHLVLGFRPEDLRDSPSQALSGRLFADLNIRGVGEAGFFDWVLDVPDGEAFVDDLLRRLTVFDWSEVDQDVLKELYESVISEDTRHRLGEYYTPDWLAIRIIEHTIDEPLESRALDPSCGSGTFVFHAVRHYLAAAEEAGRSSAEAVGGVVQHVSGMDIHPVAVSLAQVTYLLAIGSERIREATIPISIPVYLGDSMRWETTRETMFATSGDISIPTGEALFEEATALRFPASVVSDTARFDALVDEMAQFATDRERNERPRPIEPLLNRFGIDEGDRSMLRNTYQQLCRLYDEGRDHIWSFFVRNQARPAWYTRAENRVDVLIGNPPWLSYRFMPPAMQERFKAESQKRSIWAGGRVATQQDLSGFFVSRSVELYLRVGGTFAFVMPLATLSRAAYTGFRAGQYTTPSTITAVAFDTPWDLDAVTPIPFPVPSSVVLGRRVDLETKRQKGGKWPDSRLFARGKVTGPGPRAGENLTWEFDDGEGQGQIYSSANSPYNERFRQGAVLVPRMLLLVEVEPPHKMQASTMTRVRSRRGRLDKAPWKDLPDQTGIVEKGFVTPVFMGEHCLPFRLLQPSRAVIPHDGRKLLSATGPQLDKHRGLAQWWRDNEKVWLANRSASATMSLSEYIDYFGKLSTQFPIAPMRVVYTKAGSNLTAAIVRDPQAIIDHQLYWGMAKSEDEAYYLTALLNAPALGQIVEPYQSRGAFGARHFDKYVWYPPIPLFDPAKAAHRELSELGKTAETLAHDLPLNESTSFQRLRAELRDHLSSKDILPSIDELVKGLLEVEPASTSSLGLEEHPRTEKSK